MSTIELLDWIKEQSGVVVDPAEITDNVSVKLLHQLIENSPSSVPLVQRQQTVVNTQQNISSYVNLESIDPVSSDEPIPIINRYITPKLYGNINKNIDFCNDKFAVYKLWVNKNIYLSNFLKY